MSLPHPLIPLSWQGVPQERGKSGKRGFAPLGRPCVNPSLISLYKREKLSCLSPFLSFPL